MPAVGKKRGRLPSEVKPVHVKKVLNHENIYQKPLVDVLETIIKFIEKHFYIKDAGGHLRTIGAGCDICGVAPGLKLAQRKLLALYLWAKLQRKAIRIIILKARKEGLSTLVEALMFIETLERGIDGVVIAHKQTATQKIFQMTRRFFTNYSLKKPILARGNAHELKFKSQEGHIEVLTAGDTYAGTALTPQFLHLSEAPKWPKGVETATALFQAVADLPDTAIIDESTANGFDPLFKPRWDDASDNCKVTWRGTDELPIPEVEVMNKDEWNGYVPLFIPWFEDPQYSREFEYKGEDEWVAQNLDDKEKDLVAKYKLTMEQINCYRWLLKDKCRKDEKVRSQEYPSTELEAFLSSGRPRFNLDILQHMPVAKYERGNFAPSSITSRTLTFIPESNGDIYILEHPEAGRLYVASLDTAEGKIPDGSSKPDATCGFVVDKNTGRQVAKIYGQISEEHAVNPFLSLCEYYNGAYAVIENNSTGKHVAIQAGKKYPANRLYHNDDWDEGKRRMSRMIGHRTHAGNRRQWIGRLASYLEDRALIITDEQTVKEMTHFHITEGGRAEAAQGHHDDHVTAAWLIVIGLDAFPQMLKPYNPYSKNASGLPSSYRFSRQRAFGGKPQPIY